MVGAGGAVVGGGAELSFPPLGPVLHLAGRRIAVSVLHKLYHLQVNA